MKIALAALIYSISWGIVEFAIWYAGMYEICKSETMCNIVTCIRGVFHYCTGRSFH